MTAVTKIPKPPKSVKAGDKGKWAERQVHAFFDTLNILRADFDFQRMPDARAARGAMKAQIADFEFFTPGVHGVLEVKEIAHDYRLPRDKLPQLARIRKRALAGGVAVVLVYHSTIEKWRVVVGVDFWGADFPPSWDLSEIETFDTASLALVSTGLF